MARVQQYISSELTHFVGSDLKNNRDGQYALLIKILREGKLICREGGGAIVIDPFSKLTSNRMIRPDGVCFCDIPLEGLAIHMKKYSSFGLAFSKSFLVAQGANPVFYIVKNSKFKLISIRKHQGKYQNIVRFESRAKYFDKRFFEFYNCLEETKRALHNNGLDTRKNASLIKRLENAGLFMSSLFGYFKCFDASKPDKNKDNYYMEREWRLKKRLYFKIEDVQRIILPGSFQLRLQNEFPNFVPDDRPIANGVVSLKRADSTLLE